MREDTGSRTEADAGRFAQFVHGTSRLEQAEEAGYVPEGPPDPSTDPSVHAIVRAASFKHQALLEQRYANEARYAEKFGERPGGGRW